MKKGDLIYHKTHGFMVVSRGGKTPLAYLPKGNHATIIIDSKDLEPIVIAILRK